MGFLDHIALQIIQGVYAVPGDSNTVENPLQILNLLDTTGGISLKQDGWSPSIPTLEGGGVWADSPLSTGRRPLVMQESNVTETMNLIISASSFLAVTKILANINTMAINARAFWTDNAQYDPVWLKWHASCGKGPQYALIYNMDMKYEYRDSQNPVVEVSLSIEREAYWRWIPPAANPRQWTYEWNNQAWNQGGTELGASATNDLVSTGTLQNKSEFSNASLTALGSSNFITIPAASIPGDAPALVNLFESPSSSYLSFIIGKKTAKITQGITPTFIAQNNTFNAADGTLGTNATLANDTGSTKAAGSGTAQRVEISFATATNTFRWGMPGLLNSIAATNRFIGRWMVFLRCRQSAGSVGDITMYLRYGDITHLDTQGVKLNVVYPPVIAGTGNSTEWGLAYMGVINSPITPAKASVNYGQNSAALSRGLQASDNSSLYLSLYAARTAGTGVLYLCDIILIPVDEGSQQFTVSDTASQRNWIDNTGYFTHGTPDLFFFNGNPSQPTELVSLSGQEITLTPGVENRLYFITYNASLHSAASDTLSFKINIIPRSRGIRDRANING